MHHYRKTRQTYTKHKTEDKARGECPFCRDGNLEKRAIKDAATMYVIPNRVQYDLFEGLRVKEHLLVVPKRHVETIDSFTESEKIEMMDIIGEYERQGYSVYARGIGSISRSVQHQHTHLIKLQNKRPKFIFFTPYPYILIHK